MHLIGDHLLSCYSQRGYATGLPYVLMLCRLPVILSWPCASLTSARLRGSIRHKPQAAASAGWGPTHKVACFHEIHWPFSPSAMHAICSPQSAQSVRAIWKVPWRGKKLLSRRSRTSITSESPRARRILEPTSRRRTVNHIV